MCSFFDSLLVWGSMQRLWICLFALFFCANSGFTQETNNEQPIGQQPQDKLKRFCEDCHSGAQAEGGFDLGQPVQAYDFEHLIDLIKNKEMPPKETAQVLPDHERQQLLDWLRQQQKESERRQQNDPGKAWPQRLTVAEYHGCLYDLTGVTIDVADWLPQDRRSPGGFPHHAPQQARWTADQQRMYFNASKKVLEHLGCNKNGLYWSKEPVTTAFQIAHLPESTRDEFVCQWLQRCLRKVFTAAERQKVISRLRADERSLGSIERALRAQLQFGLMSPGFLLHIPYRQLVGDPHPLIESDLQRRLATRLWQGLVDSKIIALFNHDMQAKQSETISSATIQEILADDRSLRFAEAFITSWLQYFQFKDHRTVDVSLYGQYNDVVQRAMYEEPYRYFRQLLLANEKPSALLLHEENYIDPMLARYYKVEHPSYENGDWQWVKMPHRRGWLSMGAIQVYHAYAQRSSPVRRGFWYYHVLLGKHMASPPADIPALPLTERQAEQSQRALLAAHRRQPACAQCHDLIDPFGLALEAFGPGGEWRTTDLAGRPIDAALIIGDTNHGEGLPAILTYFQKHHLHDFHKQFTRQLAAYLWGRDVQAGDGPLLRRITKGLDEGALGMRDALVALLNSPAFLHVRPMDWKGGLYVEGK